MRRFLLLIALLAPLGFAAAKDYSQKVHLWRGVPGMETQVRDTILYVSRADSSGKRAPCVIICPGGSYHHLGMKHEGFESARWFNSIGVTAFVLRYRVAYNAHHHPSQLEDIQMAIAHVREHADEYGIDKERVGAIGYSAGGHLVSMAGAFSARNELEKLGVRTEESLRPDFVMTIYPVVSMQSDIGHAWSRKSLLGRRRNEQSLRDAFSMENAANISGDMPPVFLLACEDDPVVRYENSVRFEKTLSARGVPHVFVSFPSGGHGFGMKRDSAAMRETHWNDTALLPWLKEIGVLDF